MTRLVFEPLDFFFQLQFFLFHSSKDDIVGPRSGGLFNNLLVKKAVFLCEFCKMTFKRHQCSSVRGFMTSKA